MYLNKKYAARLKSKVTGQFWEKKQRQGAVSKLTNH